MDYNAIKFRCSSLGYLMTEPKSKADKEAGNLSESAKTHCVDVWISERYGRQTDIQSKFIEKGLMVEEDSITLYSRLKKRFYKKNEKHLSNEFIKGTPDLFEGLDIYSAELIIDVKSSWDLYTFNRVRTKEPNDNYYWQLQGYMALSGAKQAKLAYCLINTPDVLISDEKRRLMWKMGCATEESELYLSACEELEKAMKYDDIPMQERMIEFAFDRNDTGIEKLYTKVAKARQFIKELDQSLDPSAVIAQYDSQVKAIIAESA